MVMSLLNLLKSQNLEKASHNLLLKMILKVGYLLLKSKVIASVIGLRSKKKESYSKISI